MCGRFTMATNPEALEERFHAHLSTELAVPTYNAAPSQAQLTILNDHPDAIVRAVWGFVPEWADGRPDVKPVINARAETVATKPFFRDAFKPTVSLGVTSAVVCTYGCGDGRIALTHCAVIDAGLDGR